MFYSSYRLHADAEPDAGDGGGGDWLKHQPASQRVSWIPVVRRVLLLTQHRPARLTHAQHPPRQFRWRNRDMATNERIKVATYSDNLRRESRIPGGEGGGG